ncbi:MAG: hypothetical protein NZM15_01355 [Flavobacteriales bacterium]|nr:hypothetical protein [Flavobacteriales bacterium]MDW8431330.1 hypothetical protein [Flavobacteriales bacterium]
MKMLKNLILSLVIPAPFFNTGAAQGPASSPENLIIVTLDGYRWQEFFGGLQQKMLESRYCHQPELLQRDFGADTPQESRRRIMPFMWDVIARQGVVLGNPAYGSRHNLRNPYWFSYPGYSELFCGRVDKKINSNGYRRNPNFTLFDALAADARFRGRMAIFGTWNAFPRIINAWRNGTDYFVDLSPDSGSGLRSRPLHFRTYWTRPPASFAGAEKDTFTFRFAMEYITRFKPRVVHIGFDETDHFGHSGHYDHYIRAAHLQDAYLRYLWDWIQDVPEYRNKTLLVVTTDHGRGEDPVEKWQHHNRRHGGREVWVAMMGPGVPAAGEWQQPADTWQEQVAPTLAALMGVHMKPHKKLAQPLEPVIKGLEKQ